MDDKIILSGIQFYGFHGVSNEERQVGGRYAIDVELTYDLRAAGQSDALTDTISYSTVCKVILAVARERKYHLLEALAQAIVDVLFAQFPISQVRIRVKKQPPPIPEILDYAAVEIRRVRSEQTGLFKAD